MLGRTAVCHARVGPPGRDWAPCVLLGHDGSPHPPLLDRHVCFVPQTNGVVKRGEAYQRGGVLDRHVQTEVSARLAPHSAVVGRHVREGAARTSPVPLRLTPSPHLCVPCRTAGTAHDEGGAPHPHTHTHTVHTQPPPPPPSSQVAPSRRGAGGREGGCTPLPGLPTIPNKSHTFSCSESHTNQKTSALPRLVSRLAGLVEQMGGSSGY